MTDTNSNPVKRQPVYMTLTYGDNINTVSTLITNDEGIADFSLDTKPWRLESVSLKVSLCYGQKRKDSRVNTDLNVIVFFVNIVILLIYC